MQETRKARLASVIQQELSVAIRGLKDPRVPSITVTQVDVAQDGSFATIYVTILGGTYSREDMKDCLDGLTSASGFLRRHLAKILTIRHIPSLAFKEDKGLDNATRVFDLLKQIEKPTSSSSDSEE